MLVPWGACLHGSSLHEYGMRGAGNVGACGCVHVLAGRGAYLFSGLLAIFTQCVNASWRGREVGIWGRLVCFYFTSNAIQCNRESYCVT